MISFIGDLITDVVVSLNTEISEGRPNIRYGTDTDAKIHHRRGGSAANMAVAAKKLGADAAFFGNVGKNVRGDELLGELEQIGVKTFVTRLGKVGTVMALLDISGERSMITDRGSSKDFVLGDLEQDANFKELKDKAANQNIRSQDRTSQNRTSQNMSLLHIPGYSLVVEPLATSSVALAKMADRVSVGISSVGAVKDFGVDKFWQRVKEISPDIIVCNQDEADLLNDKLFGDNFLQDNFSNQITIIVTTGPDPVKIIQQTIQEGDSEGKFNKNISVEVPVPSFSSAINVTDTTGAGDAFTAGFLVGIDGKTLI